MKQKVNFLLNEIFFYPRIKLTHAIYTALDKLLGNVILVNWLLLAGTLTFWVIVYIVVKAYLLE